jgi:GTPase SAR1 family protein
VIVPVKSDGQLINVKVLVEGLDLAGKSSVCERICELTTPRPVHRRNTISDANELFDLATGLRDIGKLSLRTLGYV